MNVLLSTTYTPLSSDSVFRTNPFSPLNTGPILIDNVVTPVPRPLIPLPPIVPKTWNKVYNPLYGPNVTYYYDSGIGESSLAQHETNVDLRYNFLDKWIYRDFPEILRRLKVVDDRVVVLSEDEASKNDISKDSEGVLAKKSDFIGYEILTLSKNRKILDKILYETGLRYFDLPHYESIVKRAQAKYVKRKLSEMKK